MEFLGKLYMGTLMQLNANNSLLMADNSLSNRENPPCLFMLPETKFLPNGCGSFLHFPSSG
jgi:hypothetical protein